MLIGFELGGRRPSLSLEAARLLVVPVALRQGYEMAEDRQGARPGETVLGFGTEKSAVMHAGRRPAAPSGAGLVAVDDDRARALRAGEAAVVDRDGFAVAFVAGGEVEPDLVFRVGAAGRGLLDVAAGGGARASAGIDVGVCAVRVVGQPAVDDGGDDRLTGTVVTD